MQITRFTLWVSCLWLLAGLVACNQAQPAAQTETAVQPSVAEGNSPLILPTTQGVPPTFTPVGPEPTPLPTITRTPAPVETRIPATPIPFDDPVVILHLRIPALAYDRHLVGTVGSVVTLADETSRKGQQRRGQAVVLIELQQVLKGLTLDPVPEGCDTCPQLEVSLPLDQFEVSGWLRDPVLLASVQNYFSAALGPHFPPNTLVGLHRTASPFAPAQTFALTADELVWIWQDTDEEVALPAVAPESLLTAVSQTFEGRYYSEYIAECQGVPIETLLLDPVDLDSLTITIACPAYAISTTLLPLYSEIDQILAVFAESIVSTPETGMPLMAVLQYQREDDQQLTIFQNGDAILTTAQGSQITGTLPLELIHNMTTTFIESDLVRPGLETFQQTPLPPAILLVRGEIGVYDAGWSSSIDLPELDVLHQLIENQLIVAESSTTLPDLTPTPTNEP